MHGIVMVSVDGKSVLGEEFVIFLIVAEPVCQVEIILTYLLIAYIPR